MSTIITKKNKTDVAIKGRVLQDLCDSLQGKMDPSKIDNLIKSIKLKDVHSAPAICTYAGYPPYSKWEVEIESGKLFSGKAGVPPVIDSNGMTRGEVESEDFQNLYNNTNSFIFVSEGTYIAIHFFDDENYLGSFFSEYGGLNEKGSGTGSWG